MQDAFRSSLPLRFTPSGGQSKEKKMAKIPKFSFQIAERQILTCERSAGEISF